MHGAQVSGTPIHNIDIDPNAGPNVSMEATIKNYTGTGLICRYNAIAEIPSVVMSGNGTDINLDGVAGAKSSLNNCKPDLSEQAQGGLGSVIWHTI